MGLHLGEAWQSTSLLTHHELGWELERDFDYQFSKVGESDQFVRSFLVVYGLFYDRQAFALYREVVDFLQLETDL